MLRPTVTHGMQFSPEDREIDDWMRTVEKIARAASAHSAHGGQVSQGPTAGISQFASAPRIQLL